MKLNFIFHTEKWKNSDKKQRNSEILLTYTNGHYCVWYVNGALTNDK